MIGNDIWFWLIVGFIPYYINKQEMRGGWGLRVRALYWMLEIHRPPRGRKRWTVRIPLIERLQKAVWAAIMHLRGDDSP